MLQPYYRENRGLPLQNDLVLDPSKRYMKWMLDFFFPLKKIMAEAYRKLQSLLYLVLDFVLLLSYRSS